MPTLKEKIKSGVELEESIIGYIVSQINKAKALDALRPEKKDKIIQLMQILVDDSKRHRSTFRQLAEKY